MPFLSSRITSRIPQYISFSCLLKLFLTVTVGKSFLPFLLSWLFWEVLVRNFVADPIIRMWMMLFSWWYWDNGVWGRKTIKVKFPFSSDYINSTYYKMTYVSDVNLSHLAELFFVMFSSGVLIFVLLFGNKSVTACILHSGEPDYGPSPWGWNSHINYLEFFCTGYLSLLLHSFILVWIHEFLYFELQIQWCFINFAQIIPFLATSIYIF